jgi:hypothetical protein
MAEYAVRFNGSSGSVYNLLVRWDETGFHSLKCDCPAGRSTQLCKHVKAFFTSTTSMLHEPTQHETYAQLCRMLQSSPFAEAYRILQRDLVSGNYALDSDLDDPRPTAELMKSDFVKTLAGE